MAKAVYLGSAASYTIGPHTFKPGGAEVEVDGNIAKVLGDNPEFSIDGVGGQAPAQADEAVVDERAIPAGGFKNRDEAAAFAARWVPNLTLDMNRSTAELTRLIDEALHGGEGLPSETVGDLLPKKGGNKKDKPAPAVTQKVAV